MSPQVGLAVHQYKASRMNRIKTVGIFFFLFCICSVYAYIESHTSSLLSIPWALPELSRKEFLEFEAHAAF